MANLKLTFGKYKGKRINKLPTDYLVWCRDKCDILTDELRKAIEEELADRDATSAPEEAEPAASDADQPRPQKVSPLGQTLAGDVRLMFRSLAMKYHPDRGGSHEAMQALNEFHEQVQELFLRVFSSP